MGRLEFNKGECSSVCPPVALLGLCQAGYGVRDFVKWVMNGGGNLTGDVSLGNFLRTAKPRFGPAILFCSIVCRNRSTETMIDRNRDRGCDGSVRKGIYVEYSLPRARNRFSNIFSKTLGYRGSGGRFSQTLKKKNMQKSSFGCSTTF